MVLRYIHFFTRKPWRLGWCWRDFRQQNHIAVVVTTPPWPKKWLKTKIRSLGLGGDWWSSSPPRRSSTTSSTSRSSRLWLASSSLSPRPTLRPRTPRRSSRGSATGRRTRFLTPPPSDWCSLLFPIWGLQRLGLFRLSIWTPHLFCRSFSPSPLPPTGLIISPYHNFLLHSFNTVEGMSYYLWKLFWDIICWLLPDSSGSILAPMPKPLIGNPSTTTTFITTSPRTRTSTLATVVPSTTTMVTTSTPR